LQEFDARDLTLLGLLAAAAICPIATAAAEPLLFDVAQAEVGYDQRNGEPVVSFRFAEASARLFAEFTRRNVGHPAEIRVDGKVYSRPVIREPITGGSGQISGHLSVPEAKELAARLASGTKLEIEAMAD
jgi:preprotein translocase subunit SecD